MPQITEDTRDRDRRAYELRERGWTWARIARNLWGYGTGESTARAAARRHAQRMGLVPLQPDYDRSVAGQRAARARWRNGARNPRSATAPLPATTPLPVGQRTFGVEIEFKTALRREVAEALDTVLGYHVHLTKYHGVRCERCGLPVNGYSQWKVETDATVTRGEYGGEVVSPVLSGEAGLEEIAKVMRAIKEVGGVVDRDAGFHVHIGAMDMTGPQRAKVVENWMRGHFLLDQMVASHRHNNTYCYRPLANEASDWAQRLSRGETVIATATKMRSLNLMPLARIGTMEVRYHEGLLRPRKMRAWISVLLALFTASADDKEIPMTDLATMLKWMVREGYLTKVRAEFYIGNYEDEIVSAA